jgi:UPF0755 protein
MVASMTENDIEKPQEHGPIWKKLMGIGVAALLLLSMIGVVLYTDLIRYGETPGEAGPAEIVVDIPPGTGFNRLILRLVGLDLVHHPTKFKFFARLREYDKRIKAGEYVLSPAMSPKEMLDVLVSGKVKLYKITVPEGFNRQQIADLITQAGFGTRDGFLSATADADLIRSHGIAADTLEGYLFPDTYFFPRNVPVEKIVAMMVKRFESQLKPAWRDRAEALGFSLHQILTLASIIEKETGTPSERPIISSVFHNRLKKRMRLESDPTVIYGIKGFDGNITRKHLETRTPYNTYRIRGLPPGPIANPGSAAISAALYPVVTDYFFFVSRKDRTHQFSTTISEHNRAVRKFQLRR